MNAIRIPELEFKNRIACIIAKMEMIDLDALLVYGDEYRKENLRYVSNYWPLFERGALLLGKETEPIVLCAPEGQKVAEEMSVWPDIRVIPDFVCVTVPDEIDYPQADYTDIPTLAKQMCSSQKLEKLGIVGLDAMSVGLLNNIQQAFNTEIVDANSILFELRMEKSENEIACLKEAGRIAEAGFKALLEADIIGMTECEAAGIMEHAARKAGAEYVVFTVFGSGERSNTIIGRPSSKIIEDGDMIMSSLAVQYEGYVSTCEVPFAVGNFSDKTRRVIDVLVRALEAGRPYLRVGEPMQNFVRAVKGVYAAENLTKYDIYPPLHGIGCAEAESPYPDENETRVFSSGMVVNTDISLFGLEGGSNRIEEGFVIGESDTQSITPLVSEYCKKWI